MVGELQNLINEFQLREGVLDSWIWQPEPGRMCSVQSAYELIKRPLTEGADPIFKLICGHGIPSSISIFVWRMMLDRLPTKENLLKRRILKDEPAATCVLCSQTTEMTDHLFTRCTVAVNLWAKCSRWLGALSTMAWSTTCKPQRSFSTACMAWPQVQTK